MADTVLHEGPGFVIARSDEWGPTVPYPAAQHEDGRNHGFADLRDRPGLVALIPEAKKSDGLAELLRAINTPGSPLMSVGCECALFDLEAPQDGEPTCYVGGYIDVTFREAARNADSEALVTLAKTILDGVPGSEEHHVAFAMFVQPLRLFFGLPGLYGLMMKPQGYGRSVSQAWQAFDHAAFGIATAIRGLVKA